MSVNTQSAHKAADAERVWMKQTIKQGQACSWVKMENMNLFSVVKDSRIERPCWNRLRNGQVWRGQFLKYIFKLTWLEEAGISSMFSDEDQDKIQAKTKEAVTK